MTTMQMNFNKIITKIN